jgi:two-component system sensor histidine kinase HydH
MAHAIMNGFGPRPDRPQLVLVWGDVGDIRATLNPDRFLVEPLDQEGEQSALDPGSVDALILDCTHREWSKCALGRVRSTRPGVPILLVGPALGDDFDLHLISADAEDSISRPLDPRVLERRLGLLIEIGRSRRELVAAQAEIKRMNTMIAERQQFTSAILDGIHAAIITTDAFGRIAFINRTASATLGITAEQCLGTSVVDTLQLPPEGREALDKERGQVIRFSYSFRHQDGSTLDIGLSISRAEGESLQLGHFLTFRNIATARQIELDDRRVERLAAMGTMATGFAHEVRNPLAVLRILGEGLEAEIDPSDSRHEYLSRMMEQLDRIERLVKTSLQFGRPEPPRRARRAPSAIARAALEALLPRTKNAGPIQARIEADLPEVCVDDGQIIQALIILLNNALDATESPQRVLLAVRHSQEAERVNIAGKDEVRFEVIDDGPGIPKYMIARIFDPFFTTKRGGTGLGLSIAQQLLHDNCCQLDVSSVLGKGTTFAVVIPRFMP